SGAGERDGSRTARSCRRTRKNLHRPQDPRLFKSSSPTFAPGTTPEACSERYTTRRGVRRMLAKKIGFIRFRKSVLLSCALVYLSSLLSTAAWAQRAAEVSGLVQDSSGAVIVGATVKALATETGVASTSVTNESGLYRIIGLT